MHASAYLAAALVFAVPTRALTSPPPETLLALNSVQAFGLAGAEFGRFFDAGGHHAYLNAPEVSGKPEIVDSRPKPLPKRTPSPVPFVLEIPAVSPLPFERTFHRLIAQPETNGYDALIRSYSDRFGLDSRLVKSVIAAESEFTARAKSPAGALGLMQVMPATSESMGVPRKALYEPEANIRAGTAYMAYLFERAWRKYHLRGVAFRDAPSWLVQRIVAAYNAGPRFLAHRRLYAQTRDYVRKVLMFYRSKVTELVSGARQGYIIGA
ncbi:MAG: lytic transglycosylase domain-containing protein [Elusimicrobia bacterium]|nr:lytic transglycosylase domain-containing protein [Elusimicrobiota bacterium]